MLVGLLLVGVWFCLVVICDGLLDCTQVLYQFTLEASQSADGLLNALINPCSLICNMELNVNDLAEAMKALDGKKVEDTLSHACELHRYSPCITFI